MLPLGNPKILFLASIKITNFRLLYKKDSKEDQKFHSHNEITQPIEDIKELGVSKQTQAQNKKYSRVE